MVVRRAGRVRRDGRRVGGAAAAPAALPADAPFPPAVPADSVYVCPDADKPANCTIDLATAPCTHARYVGRTCLLLSRPFHFAFVPRACGSSSEQCLDPSLGTVAPYLHVSETQSGMVLSTFQQVKHDPLLPYSNAPALDAATHVLPMLAGAASLALLPGAEVYQTPQSQYRVVTAVPPLPPAAPPPPSPPPPTRPPEAGFNASCFNFTIARLNEAIASPEAALGDMYSRQVYFLEQMALGIRAPCDDDPASPNDIIDWSRDDAFHCWDMAAAAQVVGRSGSTVDFYPDGLINVLDYGLQLRLIALRRQLQADPASTADPGIFLRITADTRLRYRPPDAKSQCEPSSSTRRGRARRLARARGRARGLAQQIGAYWSIDCPDYLPTSECHYDCSADPTYCLHSLTPTVEATAPGVGAWHRVSLPPTWTAFGVRFGSDVRECAPSERDVAAGAAAEGTSAGAGGSARTSTRRATRARATTSG